MVGGLIHKRLGPSLLSIYSNDYRKSIVTIMMVLLANVCRWLTDSLSFDHVNRSTNKEKKLRISISKCNLLRFSNKNHETTYIFEPKSLPVVFTCMDLEIKADSSLKFVSQCSHVIHQRFRNKSNAFLIWIYTTYVMSLFEFASQTCSPSLLVLNNKVQGVAKVFP